jgi:hypothetical protein
MKDPSNPKTVNWWNFVQKLNYCSKSKNF